MNWVLLIADIMLKSRRLVDYEFSYAVLTSKFIDYFNIDVSNEIVDFTKASNEITKRHLTKLGMTYVDHEWIMAGEEPAAANIDQMEEEAQQEPTHQWNPFESLMIQKMDVSLHLHQAKVHSSLENITTRLENIETRLSLSNLLNPDEDEA